MYRDFRRQFPELTQAADARHVRIFGSVDPETAFLWFESLAGAVNDQMGVEEQAYELASVFHYFEGELLGGDEEVKHCIDASFVENLFWEVRSEPAATVWAIVPKPMQQLYLSFHGRPPASD